MAMSNQSHKRMSHAFVELCGFCLLACVFICLKGRETYALSCYAPMGEVENGTLPIWLSSDASNPSRLLRSFACDSCPLLCLQKEPLGVDKPQSKLSNCLPS